MRDPEKHRNNNRRYYYAHRGEINERRRKRYAEDHQMERAVMDPTVASRMNGLRATPRRVLEKSWTENLYEKVNAVIANNASSGHARKTLRWAVRLILTYAEKVGLAQEDDITPAWLAGFPLQTKDPRKEPIYRANFGRILVTLGLWSQGDLELLQQNLKLSFRRRRNSTSRQGSTTSNTSKIVRSPPHQLSRLVGELAYRCGLSLGEIQQLRVTSIEGHGIRIPRNASSEGVIRLVPKLGRFIPFGDGRDELPKPILDAYVEHERPTEYLFFSRSPRDKTKPLSKATLNGAITVLQPSDTLASLRSRHLQRDFEDARTLQEVRFHLLNVHGLHPEYVRKVIAGSIWHKGYTNTAEMIPVPEPYLIAAMCASRSVPEENARISVPEIGGGKRQVITWPDLFGYQISVDWPSTFARDLSGRGQKSARTFRLLYRLVFDFWFEGRRIKSPDLAESVIRPEDKDLLQQLAMTRVTVREGSKLEALWSAQLFEYGSRRRTFRIPVIEEMNRRGWHNQCRVCWHPERENIEREVSEAATKENRKKGYQLIASKYGVSNQSLAGHRGRKSPRRGRGETQRSHFSTGSIAPIVRCPRSFFEQLHKLFAMDLMIYSLVLLELHRADPPGLIVSTQLIEQRLALRLDESQLSVALNHLGSTGAGLINFRRDPQGFYTELCSR